MGTDQNQSGVKPRVWLATGRSAQLGADWHSPRETGAWGGGAAGDPWLTSQPLCGECWQQGARPGCGTLGGTQSFQDASCCLSQSSLCAKCHLLANNLRLCFLKKNLKVWDL